jgi:hypothetical protein
MLGVLRRLATAMIGGGVGWIGYACVDPRSVGLSKPPLTAPSPFDSGFCALLLMLLGGALVLHALPSPPWTKGSRIKAR